MRNFLRKPKHLTKLTNKAGWVGWALTLTTTVACGLQSQQDQNSLLQTKLKTQMHSTGNTSEEEQIPSIAYAEWCLERELDCFAEEEITPISPAAFTGVLDVVDQALQENNGIGFDREEFSADGFTLLVDAIGASGAAESLETDLANLQIDQMVVDMGTFQLRSISPEQSDRTTSSRTLPLTWRLMESTSIRFIPEAGIRMNGFQLILHPESETLRQELTLEGIEITEAGTLRLNFGSFFLTDLPDGFLMQLLGLSDFNQDFGIDPNGLISNFNAIKSWFLVEQRKLNVPQTVLKTLAERADGLLEDPEMASAMKTLLDRMEKVQIPSPDWLIKGWLKTSSKSASCRQQVTGAPPMLITLDSQFGIVAMQETEDKSAVEVFVEGITTKLDLPGPFDPGFKLKKFKLGPESITIENVPVIRKISIKYTDILEGEIKMECY